MPASIRMAMRGTSMTVAILVVAGCSPRPAGFRSQVNPLPTARHGHRLHVVDGAVIVLGGFEDGSSAADRGATETWRMPLASGQWQRAADMPSARSFFGSAVVEGKVLAIGTGIDLYDPVADRWQSRVRDGFPASHFAAAAAGSRVYVLGGFPACAGGCVGYDAASSTVFDPPEPPGFKEGDHFHVMATLAGEVHVVGGLDGASFTPTRQHWVLREGAWRIAAAPPFPVWAKFSIVQQAGDDLLIFEGERGLRYESRADRWTTIAGPGELLVMPASFELNAVVYILGGMRISGGSSTGVWQYSIAGDSWSLGPR
jgi:hypothetical protein